MATHSREEEEWLQRKLARVRERVAAARDEAKNLLKQHRRAVRDRDGLSAIRLTNSRHGDKGFGSGMEGRYACRT